MPFLKFTLTGAFLGTMLISLATVYAVKAPPNALMVPGGDAALEKWAAPKDLRTTVSVGALDCRQAGATQITEQNAARSRSCGRS